METLDSDAAATALEADLLARMGREDRHYWRRFERQSRVYMRRTRALEAGWVVFTAGLAAAAWGTRFLPVTPWGDASSLFLFYWFLTAGAVAAAADTVAGRMNGNYDRVRLMRHALGILAVGGLLLSDERVTANMFQGNAAALAMLVGGLRHLAVVQGSGPGHIANPPPTLIASQPACATSQRAGGSKG